MKAVQLHFIDRRNLAHCATSIAPTEKQARAQLESSGLSKGLELYSKGNVEATGASLFVGNTMGTMERVILRDPNDTFGA